METEDAVPPVSLFTEVAPNGNVILVVGPQHHRIRVCSVVLSNASKYFRNLFGPHFSEGQGLTLDPIEPKEVRMPEDDFDSLELICMIIHLRNNPIPRSLDTSEFLRILATADKFECLAAMKFVGSFWLAEQCDVEDYSLGQIIPLVIAACLLDDPKCFKKATWQFISNWDGSFMELSAGNCPLSDNLLLHVLYAMAEKRNEWFMKFFDVRMTESTDIHNWHESGCSKKFTSGAISEHLHDEIPRKISREV